jgi:hypothetical protein
MNTECPASATFNLADYGSVWIHTLGAIPGITTLSANLTSTCDDSAQLTYGIGMDQTTVAMANGPIYLSDMQTEDVYEYVIGVISETACTARFDDVEVTP